MQKEEQADQEALLESEDDELNEILLLHYKSPPSLVRMKLHWIQKSSYCALFKAVTKKQRMIP
jgi:hypothetical protein